MSELADKARRGRLAALQQRRKSGTNLFWTDRRNAELGHSVIAQISDQRMRMGPRRMALLPPAETAEPIVLVSCD